MNSRGELELEFRPALSGWLFSREAGEAPLWINGRRQTVKFAANTFAFSFLGGIIVTYHNPRRRDTFGADAVEPTSWKITDLNGKTTVVEGNTIRGALARQIRDRKISKIDIELG